MGKPGYFTFLIRQNQVGQVSKKLFFKVSWQICIFVLTVSTAFADYGLMLGSFRERNNAEKYMSDFLAKSDEMKLTAFIEESRMQGRGLWYRVCVGPFEGKNEAVAQQIKLKADGLESLVVIVKSKPEATHNSKTGKEISNQAPVNDNYRKKSENPSPPLIPPDPSNEINTNEKEIPETTQPQSVYAQTPSNAQLTNGSDGTEHQSNREEKNQAKTGNQRNGTFTQTESFLRHDDANKNMPDSEPTRLTLFSNTADPKDSDTPPNLNNEAKIVEPGDVLSIEIPGQKEMSQLYDVDPNGNIYLLTVGGVKVAGLNVETVEKEVAQQMKQILTKGQLPSIKIAESQRYINIQGGVNYPGWYRVPKLSRLNDLFSMAGGLVSGVDPSQIRLKRKTEAGFSEIRTKETLSLSPNDILAVPIPKEFANTIDSGDLLFINIPSATKTGELSEIEKRVVENQVKVDQNGYIYVPDYGHIFVKGKAAEEIGQIITERLPKYLARSTRVQVNIIEKRHYVQILGHVETPGWYDVPETSNLQSALSAAGGAVDGAIMSNITISRKWEGMAHSIRVNLYQFTITGDIRLLPPIHENDTIFVPISSSFGNVKRTLSQWQPPPDKLEEDTGTKIRIFGAVNNPGTYEAKEDMDILDLMITAGGNRDDADLTRTLVIRDNKSTNYDINELILQSAKGLQKLPEVRSGDSVYIAFVKKAGYEKQDPKEMVRVFGAVYQPGIYEWIENMNIMDALAVAKGVTFEADQANFMIVRVDGTVETFDLKKFLKTDQKDVKKTPKIGPGETVYVHFLQREGMKEPDPKRMIRVIGAVRNPGIFEPIKEGNLLDAVSLARGMTYDADLAKIVVSHSDGTFEKFDFQEFMEDKTPDLTKLPKVNSADTVYVHYLQHLDMEKAEPIYVLGKVDTPGQYSLAEGGMTVFQVIALAGGLDEWADTDGILVIRIVDGRQQNIPYNWRKAISGKFPELNIRLRAFDTVYVP